MDNAALKSFLATPHPSRCLAQWGLALQDLDLEIKHHSGKVNQNANALLRNPIGGQNRALESVDTSNLEALTIAKLLVEWIVLTHGVPRQLLSDRGANFTSTLMSEVYRLLGVKKIYTTAYHPQTDGTVERFNRTLLDMLAKMSRKDPKGWDNFLPYALFSYRTTPHCSTQMSPYKLMFGWEAIIPTKELIFPPEDRSYSGSYLEDILETFGAAWKIAQENIKKAQSRQKKNYDVKPEHIIIRLEIRCYCICPP